MICLMNAYLHKFNRKMLRVKLKHVCIFFGIIILLEIFGVFTHIFEKSYINDFKYPYEGSIKKSVEALKSGKKPDVEPINAYDYNYINDLKNYCVDNDYRIIHIIFLIKSACEHFERRQAIRMSWGFKKRFFDVSTRIVFLLGNPNNELQMKIHEESMKYKDILQIDFIDSYYNNTIKTMTGFKWAVTHCSNAKFYMFVDDDIYVSVKNVLRFIRNPTSYPDYLKEPNRMGIRKKRELFMKNKSIYKKHIYMKNISIEKKVRSNENFKQITLNEAENPTEITNEKFNNCTMQQKQKLLNFDKRLSQSSDIERNNAIRRRRQVFDFELSDDARLFAGYVILSAPHRHKTSKWYVSLAEYPYDMWPPYITAGSYIVSKKALIDMYYTSFYTKHFRFDDIYLGLLAKKADVEPFHCDEFHFYKKDYTEINYKYVITSHGYDVPHELLNVWNEQKSLGNA